MSASSAPPYRLGRLGLDEELLLLQRLEGDSNHSVPRCVDREWQTEKSSPRRQRFLIKACILCLLSNCVSDRVVGSGIRLCTCVYGLLFPHASVIMSDPTRGKRLDITASELAWPRTMERPGLGGREHQYAVKSRTVATKHVCYTKNSDMWCRIRNVPRGTRGTDDLKRQSEEKKCKSGGRTNSPAPEPRVHHRPDKWDGGNGGLCCGAP